MHHNLHCAEFAAAKGMVRGMTPTIYAMAHRASEAMQGNIDGAVHGGENFVVYMRYQINAAPRQGKMGTTDKASANTRTRGHNEGRTAFPRR